MILAGWIRGHVKEQLVIVVVTMLLEGLGPTRGQEAH